MQEAKEAAGEAAAQLVEDGMTLGLGTGSTTTCALRAIGRRVEREQLNVAGVPTSPAAAHTAREAGIPLVSFDDLSVENSTARLDLAFDGADEVDPELRVVKGRGAAHSRERVVAHQAERFVALVDPSKEVDRLGTQAPVPVEFIPMARAPVTRAIERLGGRPALRTGKRKDGPVVTDQGLWVIDAHFDEADADSEAGIDDPEAMSKALRAIPGVLDHGLFLSEVTTVLIGHPDGSATTRRSE
jgi:ribose 5-phosphate isomerase A